jgi:hypothetical protein
VVSVAQLPGRLSGDVDFDVFVSNGERGVEPVLLLLGEAFASATEDVADPLERVPAPTGMPEAVLLHPASYLVHGLGAEFDDSAPSARVWPGLAPSSTAARRIHFCNVIG